MRLLGCIEMAAGLPPGTLPPDAIGYVAQEGDIDWVIARLPDGRWAATDDAEIAPDRVELFTTQSAALAYTRETLILAMAKALEHREQRGTYAVQCPVCGDGRPLVGYDIQTGLGQWQPCPDHPEGDWTWDVLEVAEDQGFLNWAAEEIRCALSDPVNETGGVE